LIFDRPKGFVLVVDHQTVKGGDSFEVSDERGKELLAQPRLHLHKAPDLEPAAKPAGQAKQPTAPKAPAKAASKPAAPDPAAKAEQATAPPADKPAAPPETA
jgi:hypothetical protein